MYFHKAQEKPRIWGSFQDRQYSIWRNLEDIYRVDHESEVLIMPLFWGLSCLDYSGKGNHGTNHGVTYKDGNLNFNGTADYVNMGDAAALDGATSCTISIWTKLNSLLNDDSWVRKWSAGKQAYAFTIGGLTSHDEFRLVINDNSQTNLLKVETSIANLENDVLYNLVGVWNGGNSISLYKDKISQSTIIQNDRSPSSIANVTEELSIGAKLDDGVASAFIDGLINEVRISNTNRTVDQIALFHDRPWDLYRRVARPVYSLPISSSSSSQSASSESVSSSISVSISTSNSSESISLSVSSSSESISISDSESSSYSESISTSSSSESASISQSSSISISESISFSSESISASNSQSSSISISESTSLSSESISSSQSISISISASSSSESISVSQSDSISASFSSSSESISVSSSISASLSSSSASVSISQSISISSSGSISASVSSSSQSISISSSISQSISSSSISVSASVSGSLSQSISFSSESISSSSSSSQSIFLGEAREIFIIEPLQTAFKIEPLQTAFKIEPLQTAFKI